MAKSKKHPFQRIAFILTVVCLPFSLAGVMMLMVAIGERNGVHLIMSITYIIHPLVAILYVDSGKKQHFKMWLIVLLLGIMTTGIDEYQNYSGNEHYRELGSSANVTGRANF